MACTPGFEITDKGMVSISGVQGWAGNKQRDNRFNFFCILAAPQHFF